MEIRDGLLAIANEVLSDVQKEVQAIIQAAEDEAKNILTKAKEQADQTYQTILKEAQLKAEAERRKIASLTEVEIRNLVLLKKEDLLQAAFEKALDKLKAFVETEKYHNYLLDLIEEGAKKVGLSNITVQVNAKDKTWLTQDSLDRISERIGFKLALSNQTESCLGGCKLRTADNKIIYDSTIDYRLQELKLTLRAEIAKIRFGRKT